MVYLAAASAVTAVLLTILNFFKGSADWVTQLRQGRTERKVDSIQLQVNAWKVLVTTQEKRNNLLEKRVSEVENRLEECERERDQMYRRYILKEGDNGPEIHPK